MRILWIDDDYDEQKKQNWFGDILEQHEVQAIANFEEASDEISVRLEHYDLMVIDINLFKEGTKIESIINRAEQFDLSPREYLQEGGFHLYLQLLKQGFAQNRIIFLTGNVDTEDDTELLIDEMKETRDVATYKERHNKLRTKMSPEEQQTFDALVNAKKREPIFTFLRQWQQDKKAATIGKFTEELKTVITGSQLDDNKKNRMFAFVEECKQKVHIGGNDIHDIYNRFKKRFNEARLIPPKAIKKSPIEVAGELQQWLRQFCERDSNNPITYDYLTLRRGILDVLNHIEDNKPPLNASFDKDSDDPVNISVFLTGLRFLLQNHKVPPSDDETQYLYLSLCDYLTKPFERFASKDLYKGTYKPIGKLEIKLDKEYAIPAYLVRNWIAHTVMDNSQSKLDAQDVGFIFLTVIKCMLGNGGLKAFKSFYCYPKVDDDVLINQLVDLQNQRYDYLKPIFDVISSKGQKNVNSHWQTEDFVGHIYASFLFCCVTVARKTKAKKKPQTSSYWVNLTYNVESKSDNSLKSIAYHRLKERKF